MKDRTITMRLEIRDAATPNPSYLVTQMHGAALVDWNGTQVRVGARLKESDADAMARSSAFEVTITQAR